MKKICITFITFLIVYLSISFSDTSQAQGIDFNMFDKPITFETISNSKLNILSRKAIIYERNSKTILFEKNIYEPYAMASTTKIMTAIIVLENANLNDIVTISGKAANTGGSRLGLHYNDKVSVKDLLYGLLLCSGNDAAVALAEHVAGNYASFMIMMNRKALSLGLSSTHFESPHGLDSDNHFTTAFELAKLTDYALNIEKFVTIVGTKKYTIYIDNNPKIISNTNELLGNSNVYGVKTGFTGKAGRCLVTSAKNKNNLDIIVVVLGADTKSIRTSDSKKLINYAFENYTLLNLKTYIENEYFNLINNTFNNVTISKSYLRQIHTKLSSIKYTDFPILLGSKPDINIYTSIYSPFNAPIKQNKPIGNISLYLDNKYIFSTEVQNTSYIKNKSILDYFYFFIKNFKNILNNVKF